MERRQDTTTINVLLVEDNPADVRLVRELLATAPAPYVALAHVARLADVAARLTHTPADVILLDLSLPDAHGVETVARVRAVAPDVPIVVMSGSDDEALALAGVREGAQDYLVKGRVEGDGLARALRYAVERHRQAEALCASEERYRRLVELAQEGIWRFDTELRTTYVNQTMAALLGYTAAEMVGRGIFTFMDEEGQRLARATMERHRDGRVEAREFTFRRADGEPVWALLSATPLVDRQGASSGAFATVVDITARKAAEEALHRERAFLRAVLETVEAGIVACDERGTLTLFNRATREFHDLPAQPLPPAEWATRYDLYRSDGRTPLPPEDIPLARALAGERVRDAEMVIAPRGKPPRTLLASGQRLVDAAGQVRGAVVAMHDITGRIQAEEALRESNARYETVLAALHDGVVMQYSDGRIGACNGSAERILGLTAAQMMGRVSTDPRWRTVHPDGSAWPGGEHPSMAALRTGRPCAGATMGVHKPDGTLTWLSVNARPLVRSGATTPYAVVSSFSDITERLAVDRLKDEFIAVVSHELRTPLTAIRGSLGLLAGGACGALPVGGQRMLDIAVAQTDRLVRLITDILDIERMNAGDAPLATESCDAAPLLEQAVEALCPVAVAAAVAVAVSCPPLRLPADPDRLVQVLTNLLGNAIKFSPRGGTVRLAAARRGGEIVFSVADQGRGIPADKQQTIFERFVQVDASDARDKGGTGLGLAICRGIVRQHGGRIWVESRLGGGSTFSFAVPAGAAARPAPACASGAPTDREKEG